MEEKTAKWIIIIKEIFITQMNHSVFFPLYILITSVFSDLLLSGKPSIGIWFILGLTPILFYFFRIYLKYFWQSAILVLLYAAMLYALPGVAPFCRIIHLLIVAIYVIESLKIRSRHSDFSNQPIYLPLIFPITGVTILILHHLGHREWDNILLLFTIFSIGLFFIQHYITQYLNFLSVNQSSASHIPSIKMFRSGITLVSFFTLFGIICLFIVSNLNLFGGVFSAIRSGLFAVLRFLFSLFPSAAEPEETAGSEELVPFTPEEMPIIEESSEPFFLWTILEYLIEIAFVLGLIILCIWLLWHLILFLKSRWSGKIAVSEVLDESISEIREKCDIASTQGNRIVNLTRHFSPQERIRRIYKKKVSDESTLVNPEYLTADEHGVILNKHEMSSIYNYARYSNHPCSSEDVKAMKDASK
ncbi:MAG: hypothetical protein K6G30_07780 [Acetatifactor sp.]|nr:hypothetical protein [Acetatifactor sp.]